jgi:hypothetical protein
MKDLSLTLTAPESVLTMATAIVLLAGTDGWLVVKSLGLCVPIVTYILFAHVTMLWAAKVRDVGVEQEKTWRRRLYSWHGVSVVLVIVLSAAGSCIILCAVQMQRWLGGAS